MYWQMMEPKSYIIVVDDHPEIRNSVARYLKCNGMEVATAQNAAEMNFQIRARTPDLIVLDVMMPGESGLTACARLRETTSIPVLLLTALDSDADLLKGFETGADDYIAKPFNPPELLARIKAILRRTNTAANKNDLAGQKVLLGGATYDVDARVIEREDGRMEVLTSGEAMLLLALIENARVTLSRDDLLLKTTGRLPGPFDRTIDNQVSRLRKKIEPDVLRPRLIATVRNGGYVLSCDVEILP